MTRFVRSLLPAVVLALCVLPAVAQDWAKAMLEKSNRHHEYVPVMNGSRKITTYVAYPEVKDKAPVIVLIHEIFGESDWFKLQADELAAKGYIVVAPDLLSGVGPGEGGTDALQAQGGRDAVTKAVMGLPPDQVMSDLDAVADYGKKLPSANGKLFVAGFCWGGSKSFAFATHRSDLQAAFVFYGTPPPAADMAKINAPVYGFYGEMDARVGATVPQTVIDMKDAGKLYEPVTYAGAGHGFMRGGQDPAGKPADKKAFDDGFARMLKELKANAVNKKMAAVSRPHKMLAQKAAPVMECSQMNAGSM
jgi:carboxymethylenebutenolidase